MCGSAKMSTKGRLLNRSVHIETESWAGNYYEE